MANRFVPRTVDLSHLDTQERKIVLWHSKVITASLINKDLTPIYLVARQDTDIGPNNLRHELKRSIVQLGKDLEDESPLFEGVGLGIQIEGLAGEFASMILADTSRIEDQGCDCVCTGPSMSHTEISWWAEKESGYQGFRFGAG
jgi:hypothetical protein